MRISRSETEAFADYAVTARAWWWPGWLPSFAWASQQLTGVLEADDISGLVVRQVFNRRGEAVYTNGAEEIALNDAVRVLLLLQDVRRVFLPEFRPKVISLYLKDVRIINRRAMPASGLMTRVVNTDG